MSSSITNTNSTSRASSLISEHRAAAGSIPSSSTQSGLASPGSTSTSSGASFASTLIGQHRSAASEPANTGSNNRVNYESTPLPSYANNMAGQTQTQAPPSYAGHMAGQTQTSGNSMPDTDPHSIASGGHKPSMGVGSLRESAVGSGGGLLTGDYANVYDPNALSLGGEDGSAGMHDYTSSRQDLGNGAFGFSEAGTSYGAELILDEDNFSASASAGAGAYTSLDWSDERGNYGNANAAAHASVGAKSSNTINEESGIRSITNGVGAGATASVGGYLGDEDGYTNASVAASVDMNAEATIHTTEGGIPVGMAANVGGDIGIEGELTQNRTTDKGFSETTVSGGLDIGMGAGAEAGMNSEGNFVLGGDVDLGPIGGGVYMELDIGAYEEHGKLIDDKWHDGDYLGATAKTANMLWDTAETVPGLGIVTGIAGDVANGLADGVSEFADGDVLGGMEALGDGFLNAWENLPLAGDGLGALRDWVRDGGINDALDAAGDLGEEVGEELEDAAHAAFDFGKDAVNAVGEFTDESLERAGDVVEGISESIIGEKATKAAKDALEDVTDGIKEVVSEGVKRHISNAVDVGEGAVDVAEKVGEGIKDVAEGVGEGLKDTGKAIGKVFGF